MDPNGGMGGSSGETSFDNWVRFIGLIDIIGLMVLALYLCRSKFLGDCRWIEVGAYHLHFLEFASNIGIVRLDESGWLFVLFSCEVIGIRVLAASECEGAGLHC